jgi:hypothetical protein
MALARARAWEVFLELPEAAIDGPIADGFLFYRRSPRLVRLVVGSTERRRTSMSSSRLSRGT